MLELYQIWDSTCCMKVRMVLAEKGLEYESRIIESHKFDHFRPEYSRLNPHHLVPTLVHDGVPVIQSGVIQEYLDDAFPEPGLTAGSPLGDAKMREWMREEEEFLFKLVRTMTFNIMIKLRAQVYGVDQLREWADRQPNREGAEDYLKRMTSPPDMEAVKQAERQFEWHMQRFEKHLETSGGPWVCGEKFTLADVSLAPIFDRIESLDRSFLWQGLPSVEGWYERIKQRPSFQAAAPAFENRLWGPRKPVPAEPALRTVA